MVVPSGEGRTGEPVTVRGGPESHDAEGGPRVFLSYRTADTGPLAEGLAGLLREDLGGRAVFRDKDDLVPGQPWRPALVDAVGAADAVVVLIGPDWLGAGPDGRRIDAEDDPVRQEVEQAVQGREGRAVVPVLVDGADRPAAPPEVLGRLGAFHSVSAGSREIVDRSGEGYQRLLVGVWSGLRARTGSSVLVLADRTPVAQARLDEMLARMTEGDLGEVVEISRFVSGAALVTVRSARQAARRWPDVVVLAEGTEESATLRGRLAAALDHPGLGTVAVVGATGALAGAAAATAGVQVVGSIGELVGGAAANAGVGAGGATSSMTQRALEAYQARPRLWWAAGGGTVVAAGAAAVVLAGSAEIGMSVEHAGFAHTVASATLRANPPGEADVEVDPDPGIDHYLLDYRVRNLGVETNALRFVNIPAAETWSLLLDDGTEIPSEGMEEVDTGWFQPNWDPMDGEKRFLLSFPLRDGQDPDGARLSIHQFDYAPEVVGLTDGEVETASVPVEVTTQAPQGPLGWDSNRYEVELSDVWASVEAGVDDNGETLPSPDFGLQARAARGNVFVHFEVTITPVDTQGGRWPAIISFPVPHVDGRAVEGGTAVGAFVGDGLGAVHEPVTVRGVVEVPVDAQTVGIAVTRPDEPGSVAELDPAFLEEFR